MRYKNLFLAICIPLILALLFFYKTVTQGLVPFPGDLLIAEYSPWSAYSYLGYNPGSYPNKAQYFDVLRQIYPWKTAVVASVRQGSIPLWNPYNFSGSPLLANIQSSPLYPLSLLYYVFPQITAWTILLILQPFLTLLFTYLFARTIGMGKIAAWFASISYAFSSFSTVWFEYNTIGHVTLWLPLSLFLIERLIKKRSIGAVFLFITVLTFSLLAGHVQVFLYAYGFVMIYTLMRLHGAYRKEGSPLWMFGVAFIAPFGLGAVQLIPSMELLAESARSPHEYQFLIDKILIQPWQLIMVAIPDFFGNPATRNYWLNDTYVGKMAGSGLVALTLALFSFARSANRLRFLFIGFTLLLLLYVTKNPFTMLLFKVPLPFVSSSSPTLAGFLIAFCISILAGFGIDVIKKKKLTLHQIVRFLAPVMILFALLWVWVGFQHGVSAEKILVTKRNLLYATALFIAASFLLWAGSLKNNIKHIFLVLLLLLNTFDLFRSFTKFNPFVPSQLVFPETHVFEFLAKNAGINRFWGYGTGTIEANIATQYEIYSPDGYDPLYPRRYGEFLSSSKEGIIAGEFTRFNRSDALVARGFGREDISKNQFRLRVLDLLGVKYVVDREDRAADTDYSTNRFINVFRQDGWVILKNNQALPRAFIVSDYRVFKSKEEFERLFFDPQFDLSKTILLEKSIPLVLDTEGVKKRAELIRYHPNEVVFQTETDGNYLLFLSDTFYPGWIGTVDAIPTSIYRANYAFRAIYVPKGIHTVSFLYRPFSFTIGFLATILSAVCIIGILAYERLSRSF